MHQCNKMQDSNRPEAVGAAAAQSVEWRQWWTSEDIHR